MIERSFGPWKLRIQREDGARIGRLSYNGRELLTGEPREYCPPGPGFGAYESRPVYGYDDCFPTVVPCRFPGGEWDIPDHGELCWLPWECTDLPNGIRCLARSRNLPVQFVRTLLFEADRLVWDFEVRNEGREPVPFQHIMHPLVDPAEIIELDFPGFRRVFDYASGEYIDMAGGEELARYLLGQPKGSSSMLFVRGLEDGYVGWKYRGGPWISCLFDVDLFPSLGIWWDPLGHPPVDGARRSECAFEPTPGSVSSLASAFDEGECLEVMPDDVFHWRIVWEIDA
jgi:hypothetical protein